jgi:ATP synthase protein I
MTEPDGPDSLGELNRRLKDARARRMGGERDEKKRPLGDFGPAVRVAVDLVAGVAVGVFIGWLLDRWLGTTPWLLLLFFILGAAGGITNVLRTAQQIEAKAKEAGRKGPGTSG